MKNKPAGDFIISRNYQIYDFKKEIDKHIIKNIPIILEDKSEAFQNLLFKLKQFTLNKRITKGHAMFNEDYFIFIKSSVAYVAKKISEEKFDYIEIKNGLRYIRKLKLKKLFK